jgi:hypothetical protein
MIRSGWDEDFHQHCEGCFAMRALCDAGWRPARLPA